MVKQNRQKRHLHVARENIYNHPRSLLHPQSFLTPIIVFKSVGMISFPAEQNILKWNIPDRNSKENNCKNKGADLNPLRVQTTLHTQHVIIMCSLFIVLHR